MQFRYSHIRPGLLTFTLGLASVWAWNILDISGDTINVDVPTAKASNILHVYIPSRFAARGGGSHYYSPLSHEYNSKTGEVEFELSGGFSPPMYFAKLSASDPSNSPIPFFLQCETESGALKAEPRTFNFSGKVLQLGKDQSLRFRLPPRASEQRCVIVVPIAKDENEARTLADPQIFQATHESIFTQSVPNWISDVF